MKNMEPLPSSMLWPHARAAEITAIPATAIVRADEGRAEWHPHAAHTLTQTSDSMAPPAEQGNSTTSHRLLQT